MLLLLLLQLCLINLLYINTLLCSLWYNYVYFYPNSQFIYVYLFLFIYFYFDMSHKPDGAGCMHAGDIKVD